MNNGYRNIRYNEEKYMAVLTQRGSVFAKLHLEKEPLEFCGRHGLEDWFSVSLRDKAPGRGQSPPLPTTGRDPAPKNDSLGGVDRSVAGNGGPVLAAESRGSEKG